ncbi:hypothetical protein DPMN_034382 [Dreissena polymorpha]|uniref:Uncharacterized protein n=1 Tax=Dreissena polymorpha TaxID=45954 RepID=A0A9D4M7G5_DREPO|nr:hypothetical protein DPMN_034382 [Dreissena polymorpha]
MPAIKLKKVTAEYLAEKEKKEAEKLKEKEKTLEAEDDLKGDEEEVQEKEVEYPVENSKVKNFLDVEILHDKRKRSLPATEQNLVEWLDSNPR